MSILMPKSASQLKC